MTDLPMEPQELAEIATLHGGPQVLAKKLTVGKDWVYRRINGETPIKEKDELLIAKR